MCHDKVHPLMNVYGKMQQVCPKCGIAYYEDLIKSVELYELELALTKKGMGDEKRTR